MRRRALERQLRRIKREILAGDAAGLLKALKDTPSQALLKSVREQKLLYHVRDDDMRKDICAQVAEASKRVLTDAQGIRIRGYVSFVELTMGVSQRLGARTCALIAELPALTLEELLLLSDEIIRTELRILTAHARPLQATRAPDLRKAAAANERQLHDLNGHANDIAFAVARAVNEVSKRRQHGTSAGAHAFKEPTPSLFRQLVEVSAEWNALEFLVDSVAYGEFYVHDLDVSQSRVILNYVDVRRTLIRTLWLRRRLVDVYRGNRIPRYLRDQLARSVRNVVSEAIRHFEQLTHEVQIPKNVFARLEDRAKNCLDVIDAEDDLLYLASEANYCVAAHYASAAALIWTFLAADTVRQCLPAELQHALTAPRIPTSLATGAFLSRNEEEELALQAAIDSLSVELPARSHFHLIRSGFIRDDALHVRPFLPNMGFWNVVVRESLIDGGSRGKTIGRVWETFIAESFERAGWSVVGRNQRLRTDGRVVTEIDLLLLKDDLLLIAQVKAITGSAATPYDHWRSRQVIEAGCRQAATAARMLRDGAEQLVFLSSRRIAAAVRHIEPVVLTNAETMNGWVFEEIPVLAFGSINAITQGMRVVYHGGESGEAIATHDFIKPDELTTEKIRWILHHPIETLIADETEETQHAIANFEGVTWHVPSLLLQTE